MKVIRKDSCVSQVIEKLKSGEIICFPTDTLYGLLGSPLIPGTLEKVFKIKSRDRNKPLILLFDSVERMRELGIEVKYEEVFRSLWPAPLTVVFPLRQNGILFSLLKRKDVAVRIPKDEILLKILKETAPLFAPSANPQGLEPAKNCLECYNYFGNQISLCVEGDCGRKPSTVIKLTPEGWKVLREGAFPVSKLKEVLPCRKE